MKPRVRRSARLAAIGLIVLSLLSATPAGAAGVPGMLTQQFGLGTQTLCCQGRAPAGQPKTKTSASSTTSAASTTPRRSTPAPATRKSGAHGGTLAAILIGLGAVLVLAAFFIWSAYVARRRKPRPGKQRVTPEPTRTRRRTRNRAERPRSRVPASPAAQPAARGSESTLDPVRAPEKLARAQRRQKQRGGRAKTDVGGAEESQLARPLALDEVKDARRDAVSTLACADPAALQWLQAEIGEPPEPDRVRTLIARWPEALAGSSDLVAVATVRHAEALGLWSDAAEGWAQFAARSKDGARGDRLVRAAIAAELAGDDARHEHLLTDAAQAAPDSPRLHLHRFDPDWSPHDQLARLEGIDTDDETLGAILACQKALTSLRLGQLDSAAEHLARAEQLSPESVATRVTAINLRVQRARVALSLGRKLSLAEALSAQQDAIALREEMIADSRWSEAGRLLMLAADVSCMLRDPEGGERVLRRAEHEEVAAPGAAHVLGDAALRCDAPQLALELTEQAERNDAVTRIRATAGVQLGGRLRTEGLDALEKLALSDSSERERTALARLAACLPPAAAAWNEQVADVLADSAHAGTVARLQLMSLASTGDVVEAERRAADLPDDTASAACRLRIAQMGGRPDAIRKAAKRLLDVAPDPACRLLAATALTNPGDLRRAGEIATPIAHDPGAPPRVRADAFVTLLRTLADRGLWEDADREWHAFRDLSTQALGGGDGRVSAWQARILHHRGYHGADR